MKGELKLTLFSFLLCWFLGQLWSSRSFVVWPVAPPAMNDNVDKIQTRREIEVLKTHRIANSVICCLLAPALLSKPALQNHICEITNVLALVLDLAFSSAFAVVDVRVERRVVLVPVASESSAAALR
ncbi:hypothetical protein F5880DRAFT_899545 [Lentinula raphanica]|nr:hypothetical protein F5880DRAFT_899545 [Lentinula raphanica]